MTKDRPVTHSPLAGAAFETVVVSASLLVPGCLVREGGCADLTAVHRPTVLSLCEGGRPIMRPGDSMPLVALALAVSTLLHAGISALSLATPSSSPASSPTANVVFDPSGQQDPSRTPGGRWVAAHTETSLWSVPGQDGEETGVAYQWTPLQVVGKAQNGRLPVWDPYARRRAWVDAVSVGPVDPAFIGTAYLPPIGRPLAWGGPARVTMYTCVELGGCAATASGVWPEPGQVAVDPAVIPLGSTVWVQGLGTFLATDTGSLVRGAHLDVFSLNYQEALAWGIQERAVLVFPPDN